MAFFVYGNDSRQKELKKLFNQARSARIGNSNFIILPPRLDEASERYIANHVLKGTMIFGCILSSKAKEIIEKRECFFFNYFESNRSQLSNAIPTAEAAICLAISLMQKTINKSKIAILGYGRIGKELYNKLTSWGSAVSVFSKENNNLEELRGIEKCEVVFNTIPAEILNETKLKKITGILIDLASIPCATKENIEGSGVKYELALSLPAKYTPKTAAMIIKEEVERIIGGKQ